MNGQQIGYLKKADENIPKLYKSFIRIPNKFIFSKKDDSIILDLGNHYVGFFSFTMDYTTVYPDAPVRLCVKFCEDKEELESDFSSYQGGLCASWLQEEIINIDCIGRYKMPRRYSARYVKISVIYTPREIVLSDFTFMAQTSANKKLLKKLDVSDGELEKIDKVSVNTLKNCMHKIFEDGPKRDRRLWIGDLRLEALADYYTFHQLSIIRRCLYLFAACDTNESDILPAYLYETPKFVSGEWFLQDYALLFVVALCDYYLHTGDEKTFLDIYPVAKRQMEAVERTKDVNGIVTIANGCEVFIDWNNKLEKTTALNGVYLYALDVLIRTLQKINHLDIELYQMRYQKSILAVYTYLYDKERNTFENIYDDRQKSVHSVVWMILGGVIEGEEAWTILKNALQDIAYEKAVTPYMNHYVIEAMLKLNKKEEAMQYIKEFWGGMIKNGADTFYEIFVPNNPELSPYGDKMINSMCHAWSCTPTYFIRSIIKK